MSLPGAGRSEEGDRFGRDDPMFPGQALFCQGKNNSALDQLFGRLGIRYRIPHLSTDDLCPHFMKNICPLVVHILINRLLRILQKINAGSPVPNVTAKLFRKKPLMLQYLGPQVASGIRFEFYPAEFEYFARTLFRRQGLILVTVHAYPPCI